MPSIIDDFKAIKEAAILLNGADLPMNIVQPMAVETGNCSATDATLDYSHIYGDCSVSAGTDYGC
jgi:hypothetical protein